MTVPPNAHEFSKLVSGHWPDPSSPDQVLASVTLQQDYGVQIGTVIRVPFYAPSQLMAVFNATGTPPATDRSDRRAARGGHRSQRS